MRKLHFKMFISCFQTCKNIALSGVHNCIVKSNYQSNYHRVNPAFVGDPVIHSVSLRDKRERPIFLDKTCWVRVFGLQNLFSCNCNGLNHRSLVFTKSGVAIFARFGWLQELWISLDIHCFANGEKNCTSFRESFEKKKLWSLIKTAFFLSIWFGKY